MDRLLNIRDLSTREWTEEVYPFTEELKEELSTIYSPENVRVITQDDFDRAALRKRQDAEFKETLSNEPPPEESLPESHKPLTLEELRAKRLKYFTQKQWLSRLRPRK